jgi:hypothetical protein
MEISVRCPPLLRLAVIVVRADNGAGLAVALNDQITAQTNASGVAHLSTSVPPGTELRVRLDTSTHPSLVPRNPVRVFTMPDAHEAFVFEQSFELAKGPPRRRKRPPRIIKIE